MQIIETESRVIYTVLIEGGGDYSNTYVFNNESCAKDFVSMAREKVYGSADGDGHNSDYDVFHACKNFIQDNASLALADFLDDINFEEE
jgi:hypothetical protein